MHTQRFRAPSVRYAGAGALLAAGLALTACGSSTTTAASTTAANTPTPVGSTATSGSFAGAQVTPAIQPPVGTFASSTGGSYDLAASVKGAVTLVYFGYTECPDVCPTTMADLAAALRSLPAATAKDVHVVFVTSDPKHDTPTVLGTWLAKFDSGVPNRFVGLNTDFPTVQAYAAKVGVTLETPTTDADGTDESTHGAQVLAFSPDGQAHLVWLPNTTVQQYAGDIAKLVAGRT